MAAKQKTAIYCHGRDPEYQLGMNCAYLNWDTDLELCDIYVDDNESLFKACKEGRVQTVLMLVGRRARHDADILSDKLKVQIIDPEVPYDSNNGREERDKEWAREQERIHRSIEQALKGTQSIAKSDTAPGEVIRKKAKAQSLKTVPYGYKKKGKKIIVDEAEASHIRQMFALAKEGLPIKEIAEKMMELTGRK